MAGEARFTLFCDASEVQGAISAFGDAADLLLMATVA